MKIPESFSNVIVDLFKKQKHDQEIFEQKVSLLNDEIAKKISWIPMSSGGANFSINGLKEDNEGNYYFTGTGQSLIFSSIFFLVGILSGLAFVNSKKGLGLQEYIWILIPIIFICIGIFLMVQGFKKKIFDFQTQSFYTYFYNKKRDGSRVGIPFQAMYAFQILSSLQSRSRVSGIGSRGVYYNYEVNIILRDANRIHISTFSDIGICQESAKKIAQRLNIPIWDMSNILTYPNMIISEKL